MTLWVMQVFIWSCKFCCMLRTTAHIHFSICVSWEIKPRHPTTQCQKFGVYNLCIVVLTRPTSPCLPSVTRYVARLVLVDGKHNADKGVPWECSKLLRGTSQDIVPFHRLKEGGISHQCILALTNWDEFNIYAPLIC